MWSTSPRPSPTPWPSCRGPETVATAVGVIDPVGAGRACRSAARRADGDLRPRRNRRRRRGRHRRVGGLAASWRAVERHRSSASGRRAQRAHGGAGRRSSGRSGMPRVVLGGLVGGTLVDQRRRVPGSVPQPARRSVPPRRGRRGGDGGPRSSSCRGATSGTLLPIAAFGGGLVGVSSRTRSVARGVGGRTAVTLVLAGVAVTTFLTAVQTYVQQRNATTLRRCTPGSSAG